MSAKQTIDPLPLGGFVAGLDFGHEPHGSIEIQVDEPFRSSLGKNARVLLVPDAPVYRAAPALADALVLMRSRVAPLIVNPHAPMDVVKMAQADLAIIDGALVAAGRLL